jgi:catechol 2,3-dioxygenase-like lactoylglutathione lyase family enzyme
MRRLETLRSPVAIGAIILAALLSFACREQTSPEGQKQEPLVAPREQGSAPLLLDDIHYYFSDLEGAVEFFKRHFGAREGVHPGEPIDFITFLVFRPGEGSINLSPKGPFAGVGLRAEERWLKREVVEPSSDAAPYYGVHWLALKTPSLGEALDRLESEGVTIVDLDWTLPAEPESRAALLWGPDFNRIVIVERPEMDGGVSRFGIDHLELLVSDLDATARLLEGAFQGEVLATLEGTRVVQVADGTLVLSEPEALGLARDLVESLEADTKIRFGVDHLGWLYEEIDAAFEAASARGFSFVFGPIPFLYFDRPTPYRFCALRTPDGLQLETVTEEGRTGPRTEFKDDYAPRPLPGLGGLTTWGYGIGSSAPGVVLAPRSCPGASLSALAKEQLRGAAATAGSGDARPRALKPREGARAGQALTPPSPGWAGVPPALRWRSEP